MQSGTVTVGTTPTLIFEIADRPGVVIQNSGSVAVFLGGATVATSGTAAGVSLAAGATLVVPFSAELFGIVATGTTTVAFMAAG